MSKRHFGAQRHHQTSPLLLRLLLPVGCLGCDVEGDWICPNCLKDLTSTRPNQCLLCRKAGRDGLCGACRKTTALDGLTCHFAYRDIAIRRLVYAMKFGGATDALRFFARKISRKLTRQIPDLDWCVCPIPLSTGRLRERGFNQARLLADELDWPFEVRELLVRTRHTAAQAELDAKKRVKNVRRAFRAARPMPAHVLLVDDVVTSGSTLKEAAKTLRRAGAKIVWAVTIAHG